MDVISLLVISIIMKYIGYGLLGIGAVGLIVFLILKKKIKPFIIILIIGIVVFLLSSFLMKYTTKSYSKQEANKLFTAKLNNVKTNSNGDYYFEIDDFSFTDDNGNTFDKKSLSNYKYTVFNAWEPWCEPCKSELKDLEKIYQDYKDKGINLVGIYTSEDNAKETISEYGMTYPTIHLESDIKSKYFDVFGANGVPYTFILDSNGVLVDINVSDQEIEAAFGKNLPDEIYANAKCIVSAPRSYDYWAEKIESILQK